MPSTSLHESAAAGRRINRVWGTLRAILRQRCPRCHQGPMFRGWFTMNDPCPVCGLLFQREEGYFLGAMYVSYALQVALLGAFYFLAFALLPELDSVVLALIALLAYLPFSPAVFRYSRVLWIYLDRTVCPTSISAGSFEKLRLKQLAGPDGDPFADRPA